MINIQLLNPKPWKQGYISSTFMIDTLNGYNESLIIMRGYHTAYVLSTIMEIESNTEHHCAFIYKQLLKKENLYRYKFDLFNQPIGIRYHPNNSVYLEYTYFHTLGWIYMRDQIRSIGLIPHLLRMNMHDRVITRHTLYTNISSHNIFRSGMLLLTMNNCNFSVHRILERLNVLSLLLHDTRTTDNTYQDDLMFDVNVDLRFKRCEKHWFDHIHDNDISIDWFDEDYQELDYEVFDDAEQKLNLQSGDLYDTDIELDGPEPLMSQLVVSGITIYNTYLDLPQLNMLIDFSFISVFGNISKIFNVPYIHFSWVFIAIKYHISILLNLIRILMVNIVIRNHMLYICIY